MRADLEAGYGPTHHHMKKRLFDAPPNTKPRVTFYRDQNVWCPFCETMWLYLEEKRIPYIAVKVNKEPYGSKDEWFYRMGGRGVPAVQIDNRLISGANLMAVEQAFPDHNPLLPAEDDDAIDLWAPMERVSETWKEAFWQLLKADIRGPVDKSHQYASFVKLGDQLDALFAANTGGPYMLGSKYSILDIQFSRGAERAAAMLPYFKGVQVRRNPRWPHLERWYEAMESRPTYKRIVADFYTHVSATPLQVRSSIGPGVHPDSAKMAAYIDGKEGSWTLPLPDDDGSLLEPVASFGQSQEEARREAAEAILHNHRAVVGFAARGMVDVHAQRPGERDSQYAAMVGKRLPPRQSGAEIGTTNLGTRYGGPDDTLTEDFEKVVDIALRHTVLVLLTGPSDEAKSAIVADQLPISTTKACLGYLRDRISVPRDMGYPAARQLRAHLNYVISTVENGATVNADQTPRQSDAM